MSRMMCRSTGTKPYSVWYNVDMNLDKIDLLQILTVLAPYIVLVASNRIPKKSDFQREQFDKLFVPLMKIVKENRYDTGSDYKKYADLVKELYLDSFQYAPEKLEDLIKDFIRNPNRDTFSSMSSECDYLFDSYRKTVIDISKYRNRLFDIIDFLVDLSSLLAVCFLPLLTIELWVKNEFSYTLVLATAQMVCLFCLAAYHVHYMRKKK